MIAAACQSSAVAIPAIASSQGSVAVGEGQRVLIGVIHRQTGEFLASPDIDVIATLRNENGSPLGDYPGEFVWTVPDVRGVYAFRFDIPEQATYQVTIDAGELGDIGPIGLIAVDDPLVVTPGDQAPRSNTRTSADFDQSVISSDPNPDHSFYEMSVADAIDAGPSVIVFATPAWCTSEACGPLLDQVKELSTEFPGINYVHVEVYEDIQVESFDQLVLVAAVTDWGLPSEPWVFVIDDGGLVTASFEGAATDGELRAAMRVVAP